MNFSAAVAYLLSLGNEVETMKLGLTNIRNLLAALGNPQNNFLKVQVAGTNGKGSVCAFLDSICTTARIETGIYTSPHLISITERVRINGIDISENDFARQATHVRETAELLLRNGELEYRPTFFEQMTAIALIAFAEAKVELAILETGLGGRLDATTAANAEIAAITQIDFDHQEYLGETLAEIAAEKAAVIHERSKVVIAQQRPEALEVLLLRCKEFGIIPEMTCRADVQAIDSINKSMAMVFETDDEIYHGPNLGLRGRHQIENARVAVILSEVLKFYFGTRIDREHVVEGLEKARHPGRLELDGKYLFDGAHNAAGAEALRKYLDEFVDGPIILVFGATRDKDIAEIAEILFPMADRLILTQSENSRAMSAAEIFQFVPTVIDTQRVFLTDNLEQALAKADEFSRETGLILVTGSLYLVGEAKKIIKDNPKFEI